MSVKDESSTSTSTLIMNDPYYLSPSDNPGAVISSVVLTGENYSEWASELGDAIRVKRKTCFINDSLPMPSEEKKPEEAEMWRTVNSMLVGWIRATIASHIRSTVTFTDNAYKLWCDLERRFSIVNAVRVHQLKAELAACRQEGSSVLEYFGKLSLKWEELLEILKRVVVIG